jgi:hypothetical protein
MKPNNSGLMNLDKAGDPLHQSKKTNPNMASPNMQNNYYLSQSGPNQKNSKISQKNTNEQDVDYNYNINVGGGGSGHNNPLLASVNTQGSLRGNEITGKGSGITISKKEAMANIKKSGHNTESVSRGPTQSSTNNQRVGSINSNPGSTASRGSKYNIHQNQNLAMHNMQNSHSPPSVRNKVQMHKIMKNSNAKGANNKNK